MLNIINQVFEIGQKADQHGYEAIQRNLARLDNELQEQGYSVINPMGRPYKETDADIEATITSVANPSAKIVKVLKPIVYRSENNVNMLIQRGIVIVE